MSCDACQDLLLDLVYGELDEAAAAEVEQHLAGCVDCRAELAKLEQTRRAYSPLKIAKPSQIPAPSADLPLLAAARAKAATLANPAAEKTPPREAQVIALADRAPKIAAPARLNRAGSWRLAIGGALAACLALVFAASIWHAPQAKKPSPQPGELTPVSIASADAKKNQVAAPAVGAASDVAPTSAAGRAGPNAVALEKQAAQAREAVNLVWAAQLYADAAKLRREAGDPASTHAAAQDLAEAIALDVQLGRNSEARSLRTELAGLSPPQMAESAQADAALEQQRRREPAAAKAKTAKRASDSDVTAVDF